MSKKVLVVLVGLPIGLLLVVGGCDGDEGKGGGACPADLHLQVDTAVCDFSAGQVECYYEQGEDEEGVWEIVACGGENSTCVFEVEFAVLDGELYEGAVGFGDDTQGVETEGEVNFDSFDYKESDGLISASFSGTMDYDSSIAVEGCFEDLPWTEGNF